MNLESLLSILCSADLYLHVILLQIRLPWVEFWIMN
jgi:hypothetical protein